jgi:hypothetical protein
LRFKLAEKESAWLPRRGSQRLDLGGRLRGYGVEAYGKALAKAFEPVATLAAGYDKMSHTVTASGTQQTHCSKFIFDGKGDLEFFLRPGATNPNQQGSH